LKGKIGKKEATPPAMMHGFDWIRGPKILLGKVQLASAARCYRSRNDYSISVINRCNYYYSINKNKISNFTVYYYFLIKYYLF